MGSVAMRKLTSFVLLYLQLCLSCNPQAFAGGPFIWGADSRAQGLQSSGAVFSNGQPVDYNGLVNKVGNNEAIIDTSGWSTYADAAGVTPVDCTGGSPSVTWTRNTTTPLRGNSDFVLTKGATNRQGDGVAYAFSLDRADAIVGKPITIYTNFGTGTNYANGDTRIYVYDVTNATLITPQSVQVLAQNYTFQTTFAATASTSYRLCVHVASTNATAYAVQYDNFFVGPSSPQGVTLPASMSDSEATALGYFQYFHGTTYNGGIAPTVAGSTATVRNGAFVPYQTKAGAWRLRFNISVDTTATARTSYALTVNGVVWKTLSGTGTFHAVTGMVCSASAAPLTYVPGGSNTVEFAYPSSSQACHISSGDVELDSKPTWAY